MAAAAPALEVDALINCTLARAPEHGYVVLEDAVAVLAGDADAGGVIYGDITDVLAEVHSLLRLGTLHRLRGFTFTIPSLLQNIQDRLRRAAAGEAPAPRGRTAAETAVDDAVAGLGTALTVVDGGDAPTWWTNACLFNVMLQRPEIALALTSPKFGHSAIVQAWRVFEVVSEYAPVRDGVGAQPGDGHGCSLSKVLSRCIEHGDDAHRFDPVNFMPPIGTTPMLVVNVATNTGWNNIVLRLSKDCHPRRAFIVAQTLTNLAYAARNSSAHGGADRHLVMLRARLEFLRTAWPAESAGFLFEHDDVHFHADDFELVDYEGTDLAGADPVRKALEQLQDIARRIFANDNSLSTELGHHTTIVQVIVWASAILAQGAARLMPAPGGDA